MPPIELLPKGPIPDPSVQGLLGPITSLLGGIRDLLSGVQSLIWWDGFRTGLFAGVAGCLILGWIVIYNRKS